MHPALAICNSPDGAAKMDCCQVVVPTRKHRKHIDYSAVPWNIKVSATAATAVLQSKNAARICQQSVDYIHRVNQSYFGDLFLHHL